MRSTGPLTRKSHGPWSLRVAGRQQKLLFASSLPLDVMVIAMVIPLNVGMAPSITSVVVMLVGVVAIVVGLPKQSLNM